MKRLSKKFLMQFVITCFVFAFICLCINIPSSFAVENDEQLKIKYEGNTKIVSNIQNFVSPPQKTRTLSYDKMDYLLQELGVNPSLAPDYIIESIKSAHTVYSNEFFPTAVDQKFYIDDEINMVFMVLDENEMWDDEHIYTLYAQVSWNTAYPWIRKKDALCFAYAGGNVMGGYADYAMIYTKNNNETVSVSKYNINEINMVPHFGVLFDLPLMISFEPSITTTKDIGMFVTQEVYAQDDFVANCSYAHSITKVTPSIGVNIGQDGLNAGINFTFSDGIVSYCPGMIRVHVE